MTHRRADTSEPATASDPPELRVSVSLDRTRRELIVQTAIMLILVGSIAIIAALQVASLSSSAAFVGVLAIAICGSSIVLARSRYPTHIAAGLLLSAWLAGLFVVALMRGGLGAPLIIAIPTVPVIAATVISRRAAWLVCAAILAGLAALSVFEFAGRSLTTLTAVDDQYELMRAFWVGVSSLMATKLVTYITLRNETLARRLEHLASTDALTGVPNRRAIAATLESEVARAQRNAAPLSILMIDVDFFKSLNDSRGHLAGDTALRRIANAVTPLLRTGGDAVGRWGGEEFLVILPNTVSRDAKRIAERIRSTIAELGIVRQPGTDNTVTVTVGAASAARIEHADQLIQRADQALYRGKAGGRNRVELAEPLDSPAVSAAAVSLESNLAVTARSCGNWPT